MPPRSLLSADTRQPDAICREVGDSRRRSFGTSNRPLGCPAVVLAPARVQSRTAVQLARSCVLL
jgi:hypothetical protein